MTLGQKLQTLREKQGLSQDELAEKLDVSRQTISNLANDNVKIDITKAEQICRLFEISMNNLRVEEYTPNISGTKKTSRRIFIVSIETLAIALIALTISVIFIFKSPSPDAASSPSPSQFFCDHRRCCSLCSRICYFSLFYNQEQKNITHIMCRRKLLCQAFF